ncbi:MAG: hypothetical protein HYZ27_11900 [Deltaproteobacteria bacterium]|nr:hypothetical protein [Deltaproteobacteria bacterium]
MLNKLKERARNLWTRFRARSVYFQLKTLVLLAYGVVVATTILWAPPSSGAKNQIGATILVLPGDPVVGRYFVIQNDSRSHWKAVTFTIDNGYTVRRDLVRAGEKVTLYVKDFRKKVVRVRRGRQIPKTVSAPVEARVTELRIECSEGLAVEPLTG